MTEPHTHHFGPIGNLFILAAAVASGTLGFLEKPAGPGIAVGAMLFTVGYTIVRLPQIISLYRSKGPRASLVFLYLAIPNAAVASVFYGIGWLIS